MKVLERITRVTPFGVQFVDAPTGRVVAEPLVVHVHAPGEAHRRVEARPNRIGTFVLPRLPGARMPDVEFGAGTAAFWNAVATRPFVVEVIDRSGHFHPFIVDQPLPARGLAVPPCLPGSSPPADAVPLFSTASRPVPAGMAVIRAELFTPIRAAEGSTALQPAAWAVLEASVGGQPPVRGIADREGRVAIIFPYPEPLSAAPRPASPPFPTGTSLWDQQWPVRLDAFYEPVIPAPEIPDLCRTLAQPPAFVWTDALATRPVADQMLRYGVELVVRSLIVTPAGSPP